MTKLNKEEQKIFKSVEKGKWESVENLDREIKKTRAIARATIIKDRRMNIRIAQKDLKDLKVKAMEEGVPYQTLVSSIIHKYLAGRLIEGSK